MDKDYVDQLEKSLKTKKFVPDKGFEGADKSGRGDGPIAFESDFDPFQINKIFDTLKKDKKRSQSVEDDNKKKRKV